MGRPWKQITTSWENCSNTRKPPSPSFQRAWGFSPLLCLLQFPWVLALAGHGLGALDLGDACRD
jgi:hypothetical protein